MKSRFKHLAIVGKCHASLSADQMNKAAESVMAITTFIQNLGFAASLEKESASKLRLSHIDALTFDEIGRQCDCIVVIGGDGTMLATGRTMAEFNIPLIGINLGRLGFITDIALSNYETQLKAILEGQYSVDERSLISARIVRDGAKVYESLAMNDVVVGRGASAGMVEMRLEVDGHFVANQRADGLIISSPTGSTAYALSAGGPLLHPDMNGWVVVPIAPHTLTNRPIVIPNHAQVKITLVAGTSPSASFDTQYVEALHLGDEIEVSLAKNKVQFLHPKGWNYFDTLRAKLHWNTSN